MSSHPEVDGIVTLPVAEPAVAPANGRPVANGHPVEIAPVLAPEAPVTVTVATPEVKARRARPAWIASVAVGVVGLIASGTLGYLLYSTSQQRDAALHGLATTQAALKAAQSDAATRKVTADYVALYMSDSGKVEMDYQNIAQCTTYSECRTAAQQWLSDMQAFQSDRKSARVPSDLSSVDADLGDALSAGIAGDQEFILGMDNDDLAKIKEGGNKVEQAMLNIAKAQAALGSHLK